MGEDFRFPVITGQAMRYGKTVYIFVAGGFDVADLYSWLKGGKSSW